jgi:hypothetical protein
VGLTSGGSGLFVDVLATTGSPKAQQQEPLSDAIKLSQAVAASLRIRPLRRAAINAWARLEAPSFS